jgi:fermentation-respiration switch protein FrsA (DUF1100 family)
MNQQAPYFKEIILPSVGGDIPCRLYESAGAKSGIVWIGGMGGYWDGPGGELYSHLCKSLLADRITSLRVNVRCPTNLDESVADTLTGIRFLQNLGVGHIGLVGHSFAGAVAIRAAVYSTLPETVITLAAQSLGAELVGRLPRHCALFLIHGTVDEVVHVSNSEYLYALAHEPKKLRLFEGARHRLDEAAHELRSEVGGWLRQHLRPSALPSLKQAS